MIPTRGGAKRVERILRAVALSLCALALGTGCGSAAPPPAPVATTTPATAARSRAPAARPLLDADWGFLRAEGFGIELLVPERASWRQERGERWFVAHHGESGAKLSVRTWSARRTVSRAECERELFLAQKGLAQGAKGQLLEERSASAPNGFDVWVRLWVEDAGEGVALAVGAGPGECYAAVFRARGDEAKLGGELRLAADGIFGGARRLDVEAQRAPRPAPAF